MAANRACDGPTRLDLRELPEDGRRRAVLSTLALHLGLSFAEVSRLTRSLPRRFVGCLDSAELRRLSGELRASGAHFELEAVESSQVSCGVHPKLAAELECSRCKQTGCVVCVRADASKPECPTCRARTRRRKRFFIVRVSLLSLILVLVLLWGLGDVRSRRARNSWQQPVNVAVILVTRDRIDAEALQLVPKRLSDLESVLAQEAARYGVHLRPFQFAFYGPVPAGQPPPPPHDDGLWSLVKHNYSQWRYVRRIDSTLDMDPSAWDSRIYLVARPPRNEGVQFVEGYGQAGGRLGIVEVELTTGMVDPVLAVGVHELFHTLGAQDKYAPDGHTSVPAGLVDPNQVPLLPQNRVEVMARGRPLDTHGHEAQLERVEELGVGPETAKEIGWLPAGD